MWPGLLPKNCGAWVGRRGDLSLRPKTDADKLGITAMLRAEATMTIGQIAQRLKMGTGDSLSAELPLRKGTNE